MKMRIKFINIALLVLLTNFFTSERANAGLIVGGLYSDGTSQWEYVGSFDLAAGKHHLGATPYNGLEAAISFFGELSSNNNNDVYALSSSLISDFPITNNYIINHQAWYDSYDRNTSIHEATENAVANNAGTSTYDEVGDISAFISDRAVPGDYINHVFKSAAISVSEPSTIAILTSFLIGLSAFRLKKLN
jgi:hypothetical protein